MERTNSGGGSSGGPPQHLQTLAEEMEGIVFTDRTTSGGRGGGAEVEPSSMSGVAVERTPLDKCTEVANKVSRIIDSFTSEQIKYNGHSLSFQVFLSATMYVLSSFFNFDFSAFFFCRSFVVHMNAKQCPSLT
jgi:hypothetical protein